MKDDVLCALIFVTQIGIEKNFPCLKKQSVYEFFPPEYITTSLEKK